VAARSQVAVTTAKTSGICSAMPERPVQLGKVWTMDAEGLAVVGSREKRDWTGMEVRRRCELARTAMFSTKVRGGKVQTVRTEGLVAAPPPPRAPEMGMRRVGFVVMKEFLWCW
jgi:hypothetical protein